MTLYAFFGFSNKCDHYFNSCYNNVSPCSAPKGVKYAFLLWDTERWRGGLRNAYHGIRAGATPETALGPQLISTHYRCSSAVNRIPLRFPNKILYILIHLVENVSDSFLRLFLRQESMGVSQLYEMDDKVSESR